MEVARCTLAPTRSFLLVHSDSRAGAVVTVFTCACYMYRMPARYCWVEVQGAASSRTVSYVTHVTRARKRVVFNSLF